MNQLVVQNNEMEIVAADLEKINTLCAQLMRTKHYASMGEVGIFAVVQKAKSIGFPVLDALNGGIYYVRGKVELSSNAMNYLIRAAGHSISKDAKSDKTICILHGRRKDNGDVWTCSFSVEDAKKAGIYANQWEKYTEDMLFARALSRLARQLFPDVIKGCYVEGEIRDAIPFDQPVVIPMTTQAKQIEITPIKEENSKIEVISAEKLHILNHLLERDPEYTRDILSFLKISSLSQVPDNLSDRIIKKAQQREEERKFTYQVLEDVEQCIGEEE